MLPHPHVSPVEGLIICNASGRDWTMRTLDSSEDLSINEFIISYYLWKMQNSQIGGIVKISKSLVTCFGGAVP